MLRQLFTLLALITGLAASGDIAFARPVQVEEVACAAQAETHALQETRAAGLAIAPEDCKSQDERSSAFDGMAAPTTPGVRIGVDRALE
ncbi:hypothetical protein MKP08_11935 [Erythrobacter sp. LQ02-29]|uniref:hypothetical protein n=1 Tax=unclassified Erythrobacter TaxID=2633097 RepID=UPI001BFC13A1|nr:MULTISPECIES: hypothetical protein [unclassified Erythrobacter]MCP9223457.1 hypothetical protein [Erythrobacter sp. LQ02-29]QWC57937.1 hypothetical protein F7D01_13475 [Erythrobacter sp. 3-20A1M]